MKKYTTLKEIAEHLGLNVSTVSRALKGHQDVSLETRKRVKEFADLVDYKPNVFASGLRTHQTKLLGVIVSSITNLFYDSVIGKIEELARQNGYSVMILQSGESVEAELSNLEILKANRVDGIFISITSNTQDIKAFLKTSEMGIPVVFFDRVPLWEKCHKICFNDRKAAELAALFLIQKKKRRILGLFGINSHISTTARRLEAFKSTFQKSASNTILNIHFHNDIEDAYTITKRELNEKESPDVIFCMGDITLIGAMMAVNEIGLKIPEQIGVINMSNGLIPLLYNPKITYVETSGYKMGEQAFFKMIDLLENPLRDIKETFIEPILVEGASL